MTCHDARSGRRRIVHSATFGLTALACAALPLAKAKAETTIDVSRGAWRGECITAFAGRSCFFHQRLGGTASDPSTAPTEDMLKPGEALVSVSKDGLSAVTLSFMARMRLSSTRIELALDGAALPPMASPTDHDLVIGQQTLDEAALATLSTGHELVITAESAGRPVRFALSLDGLAELAPKLRFATWLGYCEDYPQSQRICIAAPLYEPLRPGFSLKREGQGPLMLELDFPLSAKETGVDVAIDGQPARHFAFTTCDDYRCYAKTALGEADAAFLDELKAGRELRLAYRHPDDKTDPEIIMLDGYAEAIAAIR